MHIQANNAEQQLENIALSIGRNPVSWQNWYALRIDLNQADEVNDSQECLLWAESILASYLQDKSGQAFFCNNRTIHILCRDTTETILQQAGEQICDLIQSESKYRATYTVFDLESEGTIYSKRLFEEHEKHFTSIESEYSAHLRAQHQFHKLNGVTFDGFEKIVTHIQNDGFEVKVLLIEDDPVTRWMVRNALKTECRFATAGSAGQAYAKLSEFEPHVVFLDINLPDDNGKNVLNWIINNFMDVCVVMFSGNNNISNIHDCLNGGASGFISKPFLKEDLLAYINTYRKQKLN